MEYWNLTDRWKYEKRTDFGRIRSGLATLLQ